MTNQTCAHCHHSRPAAARLTGDLSGWVRCIVELPPWVAVASFSERHVQKGATCIFWRPRSEAVEAAIPHGHTAVGGRDDRDRAADPD